jgi:hypothetical protein
MSEDGNSAKEIVLAAIDLSGKELQEFLSDACGDDLELRAEVEARIKAHDGADATDQDRIEPRVAVDDGKAIEDPTQPGATKITEPTEAPITGIGVR